MHSGERALIEKEIAGAMSKIVEPRGFVIESVLLKSIKLPEGLSKAIESKLEAEQQAQRMEFVLQKERLEAQRKKIEAEGIRDARWFTPPPSPAADRLCPSPRGGAPRGANPAALMRGTASGA